MKDKKVLIGLIVVVLLVVGGAWYFISNRSVDVEEEEYGEYEEQLPALKAAEVGLELEALSGNQQVVFTLDKTEGITAVEYELTYFADDEQQRAVIGTVDNVTAGKSITSKPLDLGSCSSGVCKYDKGVKEVALLLKVTKDGKDYEVKEALKLR